MSFHEVSILRLIVGGFLFIGGILIGVHGDKPKVNLGWVLASLGLICLFGWRL